MRETVKTYKEAVNKGNYDLYIGNLFGKHDNVRNYWEDQLTRFVIRPYLSKLTSLKKKSSEKVRILDLGCGSGQGYEIISRINKADLDLGLKQDRIFPEQELGLYLGLDLSEVMVEKGKEIYEEKPHIQFMQADLREGLAAIGEKEPSFDIYFSSYGSLSHLSKKHLTDLLKDICHHARNGSLIVLDLLGRYSIEWPPYWNAETEEEKVRDYSMSYLHPDDKENREIEHFPMRYWTGPEIDELVETLRRETATHISILKKFDRSILVGRHVDTGEYNSKLKPIRRIVNMLHEDYLRTDLDELFINRDMFPEHPVPEVASFLDEVVKSWNIVVKFCRQRLTDEKAFSKLVKLKDWSEYSAPLQFALMTVDRVINDAGWMWEGDPRANIIEPQLAYALRGMKSSLQRGMGCGHGLLVVLQIENKKKR